MTNFHLKILALIIMTIDHIGLFLLNYDSQIYLLARIIGRGSFVIFAFLVSESMFKTKNQQRYISNLLITAIIVNIISYFVGYGQFHNIFYTLAFGGFAIYTTLTFKNLWLQLMSLISICYFAINFNIDYGVFGILLIWSIFFIRKTFANKIVNLFSYCLVYIILVNLCNMSSLQYFGMYAFIFIFFYNNKRGLYNQYFKYMFYGYYPLHMLVLLYIINIR